MIGCVRNPEVWVDPLRVSWRLDLHDRGAVKEPDGAV